MVYITDITSGSSSLGTVLTITGSGFDGGNVTVKIGDVECSVLHFTSKSKHSTVLKSDEKLHSDGISLFVKRFFLLGDNNFFCCAL